MTTARIVDLETTGTPEDDNAEICEIAYTDAHLETTTIGSDWRSFARPRHPMPAVAQAVHHISDDDLKDAPDAREIIDKLIEPTPETPSYLVAHNARFEQHFIPDFGVPWICTYKVARVVWPDAPGHSNQVLRYWLRLPVDRERASPAHAALPDTYVTAHLFIELLKHKTPDEMVLISKYPALLKTMNFGKHKGMTFEAAPLDYLEWIRDKSEMDEDTKFSAKYWINKRARG